MGRLGVRSSLVASKPVFEAGGRVLGERMTDEGPCGWSRPVACRRPRGPDHPTHGREVHAEVAGYLGVAVGAGVPGRHHHLVATLVRALDGLIEGARERRWMRRMLMSAGVAACCCMRSTKRSLPR